MELLKEKLKRKSESEYKNAAEIAAINDEIGMEYLLRGDFQNCYYYLSLASNSRMQIYSNTDHPDKAASFFNLSILSKMNGDMKNFLNYSKYCLDMRKRLYTGNHPKIAICSSNMGLAHLCLGNSRKGLDYCKEAFEMVYGDLNKSTDYSSCLFNLALAYWLNKEDKLGNKYFKEALDSIKAFYGENYAELRNYLCNELNSYKHFNKSENQQAMSMIVELNNELKSAQMKVDSSKKHKIGMEIIDRF